MLEFKKIEGIVDNFQSLVDTKLELLKMESIEKLALASAAIIRRLILWFLFIIVMFFLSFAAAFYLSYKMGTNFSGFIIVGIFYLIILVILLSDQKKFLEKPLLNKIIGVLFR